MREHTRKRLTNFFITAAEQIGIEFEVIDEKNGFVVFRKDGKELRSVVCKFDVNNIVAAWISKNKNMTTHMLSKVTDMVPEQKIFELNNEIASQEIVDYVIGKNYQVVIKASNLAHGDGVFLLPKSEEEVLSIIDILKNKYDQKLIIIEDYFKSNKEFRILLCKGNIINGFQRHAAFIKGDGVLTVRQLIEQKNKMREQYKFDLIVIDDSLVSLLESQSKNLDSIPNNEEIVRLKIACNLSQGGETSRLNIKDFHPDYIELFKKVFEITQLTYTGLDLMVYGDISEKPTKLTAMINEINNAPSIDVAYFADLVEGKDPYKGAKEVLLALLETK